MKLLEEVAASSPTPRPSGRRVLATMSVTFLLVIVASFTGYAMMTGGDDDVDENAPVEMDVWVEQASSTCLTVAEQHPILTQGADLREDADNLSAIDAGVHALTAGIRELPPLSEDGDADRVGAVVALGAPADEAWRNLSGADDVSGEGLADASKLTGTFVDGLVDLGADCAVLN